MPTPFKEFLSPQLIQEYGSVLNKLDSQFDHKKLSKLSVKKDYASLELKERMRRISLSLIEATTLSYEAILKLILESIQLREVKAMNKNGIEFMFLPDFIEQFGMEEYTLSIDAMEKLTGFMSCEFAIRPFIVKYPETIDKMLKWTNHSDHHVRRLASEGCRPRLPWAMALPDLKKDPTPILPILKNLKSDESEYVRRSVANNLNDISKDHPELVVEIGSSWYGVDENTNKLVKHSLRTLLKANNRDALNVIGYSDPNNFKMTSFKVVGDHIMVNNYVEFDFVLENTSDKEHICRLEYAIYFLLSNGKHGKKVFKISEKPIKPGEIVNQRRRHSFRPITTRRYYFGEHKVSLIINGQEQKIQSFYLSEAN